MTYTNNHIEKKVTKEMKLWAKVIRIAYFIICAAASIGFILIADMGSEGMYFYFNFDKDLWKCALGVILLTWVGILFLAGFRGLKFSKEQRIFSNFRKYPNLPINHQAVYAFFALSLVSTLAFSFFIKGDHLLEILSIIFLVLGGFSLILGIWLTWKYRKSIIAFFKQEK